MRGHSVARLGVLPLCYLVERPGEIEKRQAISGLLDIDRASALALNKGVASLEPGAQARRAYQYQTEILRFGAELLQLQNLARINCN